METFSKSLEHYLKGGSKTWGQTGGWGPQTWCIQIRGTQNKGNKTRGNKIVVPRPASLDWGPLTGVPTPGPQTGVPRQGSPDWAWVPRPRYPFYVKKWDMILCLFIIIL